MVVMGHMGHVGGFRIGVNLIKIPYMYYEIPKQYIKDTETLTLRKNRVKNGLKIHDYREIQSSAYAFSWEGSISLTSIRATPALTTLISVLLAILELAIALIQAYVPTL